MELNPSAVTEALDAWPSDDQLRKYERITAAAARSWVEGEERGYCKRHKALTVPGVHDRCQRAEWLPHARWDGCNIVSARICIDGGDR